MNPTQSVQEQSSLGYFDFAQDGDDDEKDFMKGDDPYAFAEGGKYQRYSVEKLGFLLKKYVTSFPIIPVNGSLFRGSLEHAGKECVATRCRGSLIRVGTVYICPMSGNFHDCPPTGCRLGHLKDRYEASYCPLTGNETYAIHRHDRESMSSVSGAVRREKGEDMEFEYERNDDEAEEERPQEPVETELPVDHPIKVQRISKEGRQSNPKDIFILQSKAAHIVAAIFPKTAETVRREWVNKHILYLWKLVVGTQVYKKHSMSYRMESHTKVILDAMVDGFVEAGFMIIPQVDSIRESIARGEVMIGPTLSAKKFFTRCLSEALSVPERLDVLKVIAERS